jgi:tetratricopeptide (TPR) repeat protein
MTKLLRLFVLCTLASCATPQPDPAPAPPSAPPELDAGAPAVESNKATAPLLDGIGPLHFPISTRIPLAQKYFDQALTLAFGFNHAEAVRSFKEAARLDPTCGICYWGAALALGPNINAPMADTAVAPAWAAAQKALELRGFENPREQAYIDTILTRYSEDGSERQTLDLVYAGAMAGLVDQYPDDLHARALHAEALMDLMPWEYWKDDGTPANNHTETLVRELEYVMAQDPRHPGALHLYIHTMERFSPQKAVNAADRLGPLVPVAGHLVHMPSHIYLRVGRYEDAVAANTKASMADEDYIAQCNAQGMYPAAYYPHNIHFLWYSAMMEGRKALAISSALKLSERVPVEVAKTMGALQSYIAVPVYTYVRFGMWNEVLALPAPATGLPFAQAMHHYGRGLAHAALGNVDAARKELTTLKALAVTDEIKFMVMRRPEVTQELIGIAESLIAARIARVSNDSKAELAALKQAVQHQDALPYTEPPLWHYPVRQTLGEAQLRHQDAASARSTFEQDLEHFPNNPWSLYGLELSLIQAGTPKAEIVERRAYAWRNADITPAISW